MEPPAECPGPSGEVEMRDSPLKQRKLDMDVEGEFEADSNTVDTEMTGDGDQQEYDERFTDEYFRWKKNTPVLYDTVFTQSLAW